MIKKFLKHCSDKKYQKNNEQINTLKLLVKFFNQNNKSLINQFFFRNKNKLGFYLYGEVGVGKTMLLDFFFNCLNVPKLRMHFNEFMIAFHDFRHENTDSDKNNSIENFVKNLKKKADLIYLDEFQVTNIVDAMILGKLFEIIFKENIKIIITTNIKIDDLYRDGLQRDQFLPFINTIKKFSIQHELLIDQDYRKLEDSKLERFFYPSNERTSFHVSQIFRKITKEKKKKTKSIIIKGRTFKIINYYEGIARFSFDELCSVNIGAEDYIGISETCNFITIDNVPNFNDENEDKQQRFIILIDILYEKKIPIMINADFNYKNFSSSERLSKTFKRTISRLYELTSPKFI